MKKIKKIILLFALAFFTVQCEKENKTLRTQMNIVIDSAEHQKELRHLKEVLWPKAYRVQDTLLLDKILDESFELIDGSGNRSSKKDELNWIKKNTVQHDSFWFEIKRLDIYENGTSVIAGTGHIHNDSVHSIYQSSNVLIYRDSVWKAILSHVSGFRNLKDKK